MLDSICRSGRVVLTGDGGVKNLSSPEAADVANLSLYSFSSTALIGEEAGTGPLCTPLLPPSPPTRQPSSQSDNNRSGCGCACVIS
jgi:hypothetical protein